MKVDLSRIEGFLRELDDLSQRKAYRLIRRLEQWPLPFLPRPHGEKVEKNLYAIRISTNSNPRLYYTMHQGAAIMLMGIYKKTEKIPHQTLEQCRALAKKIGG